jgi:hypothetical protein
MTMGTGVAKIDWENQGGGLHDGIARHSMLYEVRKTNGGEWATTAINSESEAYLGSFPDLRTAKAACAGYQKAVRISKNRRLTPAHGAVPSWVK